MSPNAHPSFLELDRLALEPAASSEATRAHVETCPRCRAHLGRLEMESPIPAWVREPPRSRWTDWRWGRLFALAVVGVTAGAVVVLQRPGSPLPPAIQVDKGAGPGVSLYVKHGDAVTLWNGKSAIYPGDALRLEVAPDGFTAIRVTTPHQPDPELLYQGTLEGTSPVTLPVSWRVDAQPGDEILDITLIQASAPEWHRRLTVHKALAP